MKAAHFIKFNDDELIEICTSLGVTLKTIEDQVQFIASHTTTQNICVTKGSKGAVLFYEGTFFYNDGYVVKVADTVGSGDSFLATLIDALLKKVAPQKAIDTACAVGALVAKNKGANPVISEQDIEAILIEWNFNRNNKIEIIPNRSTDKNDKNSVLSYSVDLLDIDCQKAP